MDFTLKDLAVEALRYLDLPAETNDILSTGVSAKEYARCKTWANLSAQELADFGPWPWLNRAFASVTVSAGAFLADLPDDCHRLITDPAAENDCVTIFEPTTLQQIQQWRAGSTTAGIARLMALAYSTAPASWITGTDYAVGDTVAPPTPNGFRYECIDAGTSDVAAPTWPLVLDATVVDGTATWKCQRIGRLQLVIHPPTATAKMYKIAYSRRLPQLVLETDIPQMPADLHRIVLAGVCAYAEEYLERNWGGGARQAFGQQVQAAWLRSSQSSQAVVGLRKHNHLGMFGWNRGARTLYGVTATPLP